jgi:hypothetical protein
MQQRLAAGEVNELAVGPSGLPEIVNDIVVIGVEFRRLLPDVAERAAGVAAVGEVVVEKNWFFWHNIVKI